MTNSYPTRRSSDLYQTRPSAPECRSLPSPPVPPRHRWSATARNSAAFRERLPRHRTGRQEIGSDTRRSEEHTSELQSLMRSSYAVFCLKKKKKPHTPHNKADVQTQEKHIAH